ncbi:hypothetical protein FA13DRAFT_1770628 [Coprinellus micaceus]|uniref:HECT-type E3 ubiquitin transferase n=1 Tax=Coprinellus micaceus TaxID=71717 RepID=A0A4Y7TWL3_COPMI|nr:hypothetical protein FA13DRAFT_1770628 [Coprinellus micaceus]
MKAKAQDQENPLLDFLPLFLEHDPLRPSTSRQDGPESPTTSTSSESRRRTSTSIPTPTGSSLGSARYDPDQRPLPFGWDRATTDDGKVYFVNHQKKITTWNHPVDSITSDVDLGLPPGWELRKTAGGRTFYLDHNAGVTTWIDPRVSPDRGSPLAPLRRKLSYLASHLRLHDEGDDDDIWISREAIFEDSVEALMNASNHNLTGEFGIRFLDDARLPFQDWIDIIFCELFDPDRGLFQTSGDHPSQVAINSSSSVQGDTLKLYSFAGRLHALAIVQHMSFNLSFLPTIYSTLYEYDTRGGTHTTSGYASDAKSLRKEAFMDAFIELVPPGVLRVFTLSELHVILAAGREWFPSQITIEDAFTQLPAELRKGEEGAIPSHTNEQLLDELMVKLTGFRIETSHYVVELT